MAFDWLSAIGDLVSTGVSVYDIYNKSQIGEDLKDFTVGGAPSAIDPFGVQNRATSQQQLWNLRNDPSYVQSLPGYQFQQKMGEQAINRTMASRGHYLSPNAGYALSEFNQGLAETAYNQEHANLMQMAGANFAPAGSAAADLYAKGAGIDAGVPTQGGKVLGSAGGDFGGILTNFLGGNSDPSQNGVTDYLKMAKNAYTGAGQVGEATGLYDLPDLPSGGDVWDAVTGDDPMGALQNWWSGGDSAGAATDMMNTEYLAGLADSGGNALSSVDAATAMMDNEFALGSQGSQSWMPGGGLEGISAGTMGAGILGGAAGAYLGGQLDTKTPIGSYLGGVAGTYGGASLAGGTAAGMAVAGPAAVVGAGAIVGKGIYDSFQNTRERDATQDAYRSSFGDVTAGGLVADPTGQGLGQGYSYTTGGNEFFAPEKHYTSLNQKNNQGEYMSPYETAAAQGNYAYYNDPTNGWTAGQFGSYGGDTFSSAAWSPYDIAGAEAQYQSEKQQNWDTLEAQRNQQDYKVEAVKGWGADPQDQEAGTMEWTFLGGGDSGYQFVPDSQQYGGDNHADSWFNTRGD